MKGKHLERPVFSPEQFLKYRAKFGIIPESKILETLILLFSNRLLEQIREKHKITEIPDMFGNFGRLYVVDGTAGRVGILGGFGIGAPATVMAMEETIAYGTKKFVIVGTAGGISPDLKIGDTVVCNKSIRMKGLPIII